MGLAPALAASPRYRPDIDGLRSVAVLLVVLFHFELTDALRAGFIGVDIFFVISGFLIVPALRRQIEADEFRFRSFYAKRVRRLAPALIATTILTVAVGLVILTPGELVGLAKEATAAQLYVSNIYYWRYLDYFGLQADHAFLLHTWSLGVEEQFYLAFPITLWLAAKAAPRSITSVLVAILVVSFALDLAFIHAKPEATFYLLPTRAWEFAAGALTPQVAVVARRWGIAGRHLAGVGLMLLAVALATYQSTIAFPGWFATLPAAATVAFLIAGEDAGGLWSRAMSSAVPVYIGRISYELYLVHWPIRVFAPLLLLDYSLAARLAALAVCFLVAAIIYHLVESPIRARRVLSANRTLVVAYGGATIALLGGLVLVVALRGLPGRLSHEAIAMAAATDDADGRFRRCENRFDDPCVVGVAGAKPSWLVYGDSHADALASAFGGALRDRGEAGYLLFQSGCLPVIDSGDAACRYFNRQVGTFLAAHPGIRHVALVSTWRQPLEAAYTDAAGRPVRGQAALAAFNLGFKRTLLDRSAAGRQVVLWLPVPGARRAVPTTLARNMMLGRNWDVADDKASYDRRFRFLTDALTAHPGVTTIRPAEQICEKRRCDVLWNGRPLYHDDAHPAASQRRYYQAIIDSALATLD